MCVFKCEFALSIYPQFHTINRKKRNYARNANISLPRNWSAVAASIEMKCFSTFEEEKSDQIRSTTTFLLE